MGKSSPPKRVLVVDDDRDTLRLYRLRLEIDGHQAFTAGGGREALELFGAEPIDIAFIDLMMPGMDGYELCRALRALPRGGQARLYALTGLCRRQEEEAAIASGFDGYLLKPVPYEKVAHLLADGAAPLPARRGRRSSARKKKRSDR